MDKNELTMQDIKLNELLKQTYHGIFFDHLQNELSDNKRVGDTVMYMAVAGYYPSIKLIEKMKEDKNANIVFKLFRELELDEKKRLECDAVYKSMLTVDNSNALGVLSNKFMDNLVEDVKGYIETGKWKTAQNSNAIFGFTENLNFGYMSLIEQAKSSRNQIDYISPDKLKDIIKELINEEGLTIDEIKTAVIGFNILENELELSNDELLKVEQLKEQFEKIEILDIKFKRLDTISEHIKNAQQYIDICNAIEENINSGSVERAMSYLEEFQLSYKEQKHLVENYYSEEQIYNDLCEMYKEFYPDLAEELQISDTYEFEKVVLNAISLNSKARDIFESIAKGFRDKTSKAEYDYTDIEANKEEMLKENTTKEEMKILLEQAEMVAKKTKQVEETFFKKAYEPMIEAFKENETETINKLNLISEKFSNKDKIADDKEKEQIKTILEKMEKIYDMGISNGHIENEKKISFENTIKNKLSTLIDEFESSKRVGDETPEIKFQRICEIGNLEDRKQALQDAEADYTNKINTMNAELKILLKESLMKPSKECMVKINKLKEYIQKATSDKVVFEEYKQKELSSIEREISKSKEIATNNENIDNEKDIIRENLEITDETIDITDIVEPTNDAR